MPNVMNVSRKQALEILQAPRQDQGFGLSRSDAEALILEAERGPRQVRERGGVRACRKANGHFDLWANR